ncbi:MAG TPA: hypothetical protein VF875_05810 [Anaeromyxobacter sp.]
MLKALAVVRTIVLLFLIGYTLRAMPWVFGLPTGSSQAFDTCRSSLTSVTWAAWIAVAWVAIDTAIGWLLAGRKKTSHAPTSAAPAAR